MVTCVADCPSIPGGEVSIRSTQKLEPHVWYTNETGAETDLTPFVTFGGKGNFKRYLLLLKEIKPDLLSKFNLAPIQKALDTVNVSWF